MRGRPSHALSPARPHARTPARPRTHSFARPLARSPETLTTQLSRRRYVEHTLKTLQEQEQRLERGCCKFGEYVRTAKRPELNRCINNIAFTIWQIVHENPGIQWNDIFYGACDAWKCQWRASLDARGSGKESCVSYFLKNHRGEELPACDACYFDLTMTDRMVKSRWKKHVEASLDGVEKNPVRRVAEKKMSIISWFAEYVKLHAESRPCAQVVTAKGVHAIYVIEKRGQAGRSSLYDAWREYCDEEGEVHRTYFCKVVQDNFINSKTRREDLPHVEYRKGHNFATCARCNALQQILSGPLSMYSEARKKEAQYIIFILVCPEVSHTHDNHRFPVVHDRHVPRALMVTRLLMLRSRYVECTPSTAHDRESEIWCACVHTEKL